MAGRFVLLATLFLSTPTLQAQTAREYLNFLYTVMPLPDSVDYSRQYWDKQIRLSMKARKEMPWGQTVPEREFKYFVLPVRVNNEALDDSRAILYDALKERVSGMTMPEAALEVNHWCHEHVSYRPSDARTSSPLATMRNAIGRCGEESTFTVAALRAIGIPARQVYSPRWAHTDDNHAWVEMWVDGAWHFMGACEPEPELDKGWFNWAASRAMLVNTRVPGNSYDGPEEVVSRDKCYTEINCLSTYAPIRQLTVLVEDKDGQPMPGMTVDFRLYNYSEFYPLASRRTGADGRAALTTGYGDLLIWVTDGKSIYDCVKVDSNATTITITPSKTLNTEWQQDLDIHAPVSALAEPDRSLIDTVSINGRRLMHEDSIRVAYQQSAFYKGDSLLQLARSNWQTIRSFVDKSPNRTSALRLLHSLTEKDLRDVTMDVLLYSYTDDGQFSPRISTEPLRPFRKYLKNKLGVMTPQAWIDWVYSNISINDDRNPLHISMSAVGVYSHRVTDSKSRDIFMVAGARAMGMNAKLDDATGEPIIDGRKASEKSVCNNDGTAGTQPEATIIIDVPDSILYYHRYSLSRIVDGHPASLDYPDDDPSVTLQLKSGITVPAGLYMLTTGTRLRGGDILAHMEMINLQPREKRTVKVVLRESKESIQSGLNLQDSEQNSSATSVQSSN